MEHIRTIKYQVMPADAGVSIESFLRRHGYSKKVLAHLRNTAFPWEGRVRYGVEADGVLAFTSRKLSGSEHLVITILETEASEKVVDSPIPLSIVYEDEDLLVINKPSGMPIHPSMGHFTDSLGNALSWYMHKTLGYDLYVCHIINRLDRDTSGLLIAAKNMLSAAVLGSMAEKREIHREYRAIVEGNAYVVDKSLPSISRLPDGWVRIEAGLNRKEGSLIERAVDFQNGERAVTDYRTLEYDPERNLSLIKLKLHTGRTHQIRVHMCYAGHPLIGDFLYHPDYRYMKRQALHSAALCFRHPVSGEMLHFRAPLPEDMASLFPEDRNPGLPNGGFESEMGRAPVQQSGTIS